MVTNNSAFTFTLCINKFWLITKCWTINPLYKKMILEVVWKISNFFFDSSLNILKISRNVKMISKNNFIKCHFFNWEMIKDGAFLYTYTNICLSFFYEVRTCTRDVRWCLKSGAECFIVLMCYMSRDCGASAPNPVYTTVWHNKRSFSIIFFLHNKKLLFLLDWIKHYHQQWNFCCHFQIWIFFWWKTKQKICMDFW